MLKCEGLSQAVGVDVLIDTQRLTQLREFQLQFGSEEGGLRSCVAGVEEQALTPALVGDARRASLMHILSRSRLATLRFRASVTAVVVAVAGPSAPDRVVLSGGVLTWTLPWNAWSGSPKKPCILDFGEACDAAVPLLWRTDTQYVPACEQKLRTLGPRLGGVDVVVPDWDAVANLRSYAKMSEADRKQFFARLGDFCYGGVNDGSYGLAKHLSRSPRISQWFSGAVRRVCVAVAESPTRPTECRIDGADLWITVKLAVVDAGTKVPWGDLCDVALGWNVCEELHVQNVEREWAAKLAQLYPTGTRLEADMSFASRPEHVRRTVAEREAWLRDVLKTMTAGLRDLPKALWSKHNVHFNAFAQQVGVIRVAVGPGRVALADRVLILPLEANVVGLPTHSWDVDAALKLGIDVVNAKHKLLSLEKNVAPARLVVDFAACDALPRDPQKVAMLSSAHGVVSACSGGLKSVLGQLGQSGTPVHVVVLRMRKGPLSYVLCNGVLDVTFDPDASALTSKDWKECRVVAGVEAGHVPDNRSDLWPERVGGGGGGSAAAAVHQPPQQVPVAQQQAVGYVAANTRDAWQSSDAVPSVQPYGSVPPPGHQPPPFVQHHEVAHSAVPVPAAMPHHVYQPHYVAQPPPPSHHHNHHHHHHHSHHHQPQQQFGYSAGSYVDPSGHVYAPVAVQQPQFGYGATFAQGPPQPYSQAPASAALPPQPAQQAAPSAYSSGSYVAASSGPAPYGYAYLTTSGGGSPSPVQAAPSHPQQQPYLMQPQQAAPSGYSAGTYLTASGGGAPSAAQAPPSTQAAPAAGTYLPASGGGAPSAAQVPPSAQAAPAAYSAGTYLPAPPVEHVKAPSPAPASDGAVPLRSSSLTASTMDALSSSMLVSLKLDPAQVAEWSVQDVARWLEQDLGIDPAVLVANVVDGAALLEITAEDLKGLGLPLGVWKKILRHRDQIVSAKKVASADNLIPSGEIVLGKRIGGGHFGEVWLATWHETAVAVKWLLTANANEEFLAEIEVLKRVRHPHVIQTYGVSIDADGRIRLVTELLDTSLLQFLRDGIGLKEATLLSIAVQIVKAMVHLAKLGVIHRDLAARNVLIKRGADEPLAKLCDFGLGKLMDENYYHASTPGVPLPVKWTAPEALEKKQFGEKSDVWSFGVLLWEIYSHGCEPYVGVDAKVLLAAVKKGERLAIPHDCPIDVFKCMQTCWEADRALRPTFARLFEVLHGRQQLGAQQDTLDSGEAATSAPGYVYDPV